MYINFQSNTVSRSVKTVHTHLLAKQRKLHKYATCNSNLKKSRFSDIHYSITEIQDNFGIYRAIRYQISAKKLFTQTTDGRTDRRRVRQQ